MNNTSIDIREGSVTFWVNQDKIQWNDSTVLPFMELGSDGNSIFILKDSDNKLKFFHVYLGKGRTDIEYDISNVATNKKHFIAATWSVSNRKIQLFFDGELVAEKDITYSE